MKRNISTEDNRKYWDIIDAISKKYIFDIEESDLYRLNDVWNSCPEKDLSSNLATSL